jgi:hypothetical protein
MSSGAVKKSKDSTTGRLLSFNSPPNKLMIRSNQRTEIKIIMRLLSFRRRARPTFSLSARKASDSVKARRLVRYWKKPTTSTSSPTPLCRPRRIETTRQNHPGAKKAAFVARRRRLFRQTCDLTISDLRFTVNLLWKTI